MARMTANDFVTIVRQLAGGETAETLTDATLLRFVNLSYTDISNRYPLPELCDDLTITTADGTNTYEVAETAGDPLRILRIEHVVDTSNNLVLVQISEAQFHDYSQGDTTTNTGTPVYWFISGTTGDADPANQEMTFWPTPDDAYSVVVHYRGVPTELALSPTATSTVIGEQWDDVILHQAAFRAWSYLGEPQRSAWYLRVTRELEAMAMQTTLYASHVPWHTGSIVGAAFD